MRSVTNGRCGKWGEKRCACATRPNEPWRFQCTRAHPTRRHRPPKTKRLSSFLLSFSLLCMFPRFVSSSRLLYELCRLQFVL